MLGCSLREGFSALHRWSSATMSKQLFSTVLVLVAVLVQDSLASRILVVVPTPSHSHQTQFRILANALLARGHEVTLFTAFPLRTSQENLTEIDISDTTNLKNDFVGLADKSPAETLPDLRDVGRSRAQFQLNLPAVQDFIRRNHTFDLVIFERMPYQAYYGLFHKVGSPPLVGFVTFSALAPSYYAQGNAMNPAYLPEVWVGFSDHMTFWERVYNTYFYLRFYYMWLYESLPIQESIMREVFGTEPPSVYEMERNYSLLIIGNHFSLAYPRPHLPSIVEITGIHVSTKIERLPKSIQGFLDGAEHGVVYCSLGSNVRSRDLPLEKMKALLEAFRELPQRVIWKWENDSLPSQPDNVMVSKWLPQQPILDHPKVRLFISQGGLQSMNEATYHAVPLLVIPFFGDQPHTAAKVAQAEIGVRLQFRDLSKETLLRSIRSVLGDTKYRDNMRQLSAVFREHRADSLERAVWWIEYVIRHKGAPHLRSAALDLHWWQLLLLDVVAFLLAVAALTVYVAYVIMRRIVSFIKGSKQKEKTH